MPSGASAFVQVSSPLRLDCRDGQRRVMTTGVHGSCPKRQRVCRAEGKRRPSGNPYQLLEADAKPSRADPDVGGICGCELGTIRNAAWR